MTTLSKYEDQYLGDKQIKFVEEAPASKSGVELVTVVFNDNSREQYAKLMLEADGVVTPLIQDLTQFRDRRIFPVVTGFLKLMRDYNLKVEEIDYLFAKTSTSVNMNLQEAEAALWGVERVGKHTLVQDEEILL